MTRTPPGILTNTTETIVPGAAQGAAFGGRAPFKGHVVVAGGEACINCGLPVLDWGPDPCSGTKPVPPDEYAVVEVFGHQRHVGRISEVERFGSKMLRMDEPVSAPIVSFDEGRFTTYFLAGAAIFRMTPCTMDYVQRYHFQPERQVGRLTAQREEVSEKIHDESEWNNEDYDEDTAAVIEPAPASLGTRHIAEEGTGKCSVCGTAVSEWDLIFCAPANVSREIDPVDAAPPVPFNED